ncbi:hypothetical protein [Parendozoicomonas haliclonae]|uniref:Uncharacterized protein n=1 Tax=Parendozoicomonas haliclonae TaxID=1960125 RepID=A0A1X7AE23_9GAMM|nr:hypothetical protein [Parendozoicomonas haliclonae]SMA33248.1 hypothetical protein EHSB41UT_00246 [Parendozoicomonas haliclonae]
MSYFEINDVLFRGQLIGATGSAKFKMAASAIDAVDTINIGAGEVSYLQYVRYESPKQVTKGADMLSVNVVPNGDYQYIEINAYADKASHVALHGVYDSMPSWATGVIPPPPDGYTPDPLPPDPDPPDPEPPDPGGGGGIIPNLNDVYLRNMAAMAPRSTLTVPDISRFRSHVGSQVFTHVGLHKITKSARISIVAYETGVSASGWLLVKYMRETGSD